MVISKKNCQKGWQCGDSCISKLKDCTFSSEDETSKALLEKYTKLIASTGGLPEEVATENFSKLTALIDNTSEAQSDSIGKLYSSLMDVPNVNRTGVKLPPLDSVEYFMEQGGIDKYDKAYKNSFADGVFNAKGTKDYINKEVKRVEVSDELATAVYDTLPEAVKTKLNGAGVPRTGYWQGVDNDGNQIISSDKKGSRPRGEKLLKRYLEQGGIDPYTGKFVNLNEAELEHIVPEKKAGNRADQPDNWAWIDSGVNKWHSDMDSTKWRANGNAKLKDKDKYVRDRDKAIAKAKDLGGKIGNTDEYITKAFDESVTPKERQEYIKNVSQSMKSKSKKLISGTGLPSSFPQYRIEPGTENNHWTKFIDDRQSSFQSSFKEKYGNQKISSLLAQSLALTAGTPKHQEIRDRYTEIMNNRAMPSKEWALNFFKENGKQAYQEELKRRDLEYGSSLKELFDSVDDFP